MYDGGWMRAERVAAPVVSVGNLTLGGTGKTPCVEYVAAFYEQRKRKVAVLSRGYGSVGGRNDEALLLAENLPHVPHLQGADRVALALQAVDELHRDVLVLDDGFQHRRLARDLDVVLIDVTDPWGQGHLFPRGLLRESPRGLRRAGVVVLTRCDQVSAMERGRIREEVARLAPHAAVAEAVHRPEALINADRLSSDLGRLADRPVAAFCAIGNPAAFRQTLTDLGAEVKAFRSYPDHHPYPPDDLEDLRAWARQQATDCVVVTTQKDLVKLRQSHLAGRELWALRIRLHLEAGKDALDQRLEEAVSGGWWGGGGGGPPAPPPGPRAPPAPPPPATPNPPTTHHSLQFKDETLRPHRLEDL